MTTAMALPFTAPGQADRAADRAASERSVGRLLGRLGPDGYVVLPDGVVVGPTGVAVVETVTCRDALRIHHGELWHGRFPLRQELAHLHKRVRQVRTVTSGLDLRLPVRPILCAVGAAVPHDPYCTLPVELCGEAELADRIRSGPALLAFERGLQLARDLDVARRRWSALPSLRRHHR